MTSPWEEVSVFTYPYLSVRASATRRSQRVNNYFLSSIICIPYEGHFTAYLHKINDLKGEGKNNKFCYYHDDINNYGDIIILPNSDELYKIG